MNSLTRNWLEQNSSHYLSQHRLFTDIDVALARFQTLRPKSDVYTYDDGRSQLLLCLHGLLPISYRQASYNIPIAVWLVRDYPNSPPIVYVVPTTDMLVKPGKYVDVSGRINIDYIQNWARKSEGCNLSSLLDALQHQFSTEPPVYAKPKDPAPSTASPPLINNDRPTLPPKPPPTAVFSPISPSPSLATRPPPPLPPQYAPQTTHSGSGTVSPIPNPQWSTPTHVIPVSPPPPAFPYTHPQDPQQRQQHYPPLSQPGPQSPPRTSIPAPNLLDEESPDLSSIGTGIALPPPPPRPTNPELLRLHLQVHQNLTSEFDSLRHALSLDAERLRAQQSDLQAGEPAIRDEMARLEAVRDVCRHVAERMRGSVNQAEWNIAELRRKGDPEVDELICATSIVHNQLINLVAEDNAIEDTVYHLHRALNTGRIDLERFLRTTRVLAEEQFMKRALIEKIQAGIPIGASIGSHWS